MSRQEFVVLLNKNKNEYMYKKDVYNLFYPYLISQGEQSATISSSATQYDIIEGDNQEIILGIQSNITFKSNGKFENFVQLYLDDVLVDPNNYTVTSGSTIITLNANYVHTLGLGEKNSLSNLRMDIKLQISIL